MEFFVSGASHFFVTYWTLVCGTDFGTYIQRPADAEGTIFGTGRPRRWPPRDANFRRVGTSSTFEAHASFDLFHDLREILDVLLATGVRKMENRLMR